VTTGVCGSDVLLDRYPELGLWGTMYGMTDAVAWSSSSLSLFLLADSSRNTRGKVCWSGLS
jgi:hypothetical protein